MYINGNFQVICTKEIVVQICGKGVNRFTGGIALIVKKYDTTLIIRYYRQICKMRLVKVVIFSQSFYKLKIFLKNG